MIYESIGGLNEDIFVIYKKLIEYVLFLVLGMVYYNRSFCFSQDYL